ALRHGSRRRPRHRPRRDRARPRARRRRRHRSRARERAPAADGVLRRGRSSPLVPVRDDRPARGAGAVIRALIVDDEAPARSELRYLLSSHKEVEVVGEAASAPEALRLAQALSYDVLFLDVEMPGLTGIEAARLVRERPEAPAVVFVTAHEQYAVDAFAVEATDYLLKPVEPERLGRV